MHNTPPSNKYVFDECLTDLRLRRLWNEFAEPKNGFQNEGGHPNKAPALPVSGVGSNQTESAQVVGPEIALLPIAGISNPLAQRCGMGIEN